MVKYLFLIKGTRFPSQTDNTLYPCSYLICLNTPFLLSVHSSTACYFLLYEFKRPICTWEELLFLNCRNGRKLLGFFFPSWGWSISKMFFSCNQSSKYLLNDFYFWINDCNPIYCKTSPLLILSSIVRRTNSCDQKLFCQSQNLFSSDELVICH